MSGVTVGIIVNQAARYSVFAQSLTGLFAQFPAGTVVDWELDGHQARSRNAVCRRALERGSDHVLFLDDDHTFPPNLLDQLLSRNVPVVSGLYLQRTDLFLPIAYSEKTEDGLYVPVDLQQCPEHGLVQIRASGAGGLLIRTDVLVEIGEPWFMYTGEQSEDMYFSDRLAEHGIPLVLDLDARLGHVTPVSVYPEYEDGQWTAGLATSSYLRVLLPINATTLEEPAGDPEQFLPPEPVPVTASGNASRVEMFPDDSGRWYSRAVTDEGLVVDRIDGVFNLADAEVLAQNRWPGLPVFMVADANSDSTFVEPEAMLNGIGQPDRSARKSLGRMYGNR